MSLLSAVTGRTFSRLSVAAPGITLHLESRRFASRRRAKEFKSKKDSGGKRDANGKPIQLRKERSAPLFTSLPKEQLGDHPIFELETRPMPEDFDYITFAPKSMKEAYVGQVMQFPASREANELRKQFGLPKSLWKEFKLMPKPVSVVRGVTLDITNILKQVQHNEASSKDTRVVLSGTGGCGKSFLLLQAVEWCLANNWIVLYIPRAVNLVNSTTPYSYDLRTQTFLQPEAAYQIIHRIRVVNQKILKDLKTTEALVMDGTTKSIPAETSLYTLLDVPREEVARAPIVLDQFLKELEKQTTSPVLLAIDDFQALLSRTSYRDPHFKPIASYHLSTPRLLLDFTSGRRSFAKGAIIGALTASDPHFPIGLELNDMLGVKTASQQPVIPERLVTRSSALKEYLNGVRTVQVPNSLTVEEAGSIFEVWMKQRVFVSQAYDELFMSKYVESAGNPHDFVWKGLLATLQT